MPTLFGIMVINFVIVQAAPGGPIEQMIAQITGHGGRRSRERVTRRLPARSAASAAGARRRARQQPLSRRARPRPGVHQGARAAVRLRQAGARALPADDGQLSRASISARASSATARCVDLVLEKLPVSISLGLWTTLLIYLISIPLGIRKAVRDGSRFDVWTSARHHRRLRHPELPVRGAADRAVRRRQLSSTGSRCAACVSDELATQLSWPARDRSTISGTWRCRCSRMVIGGFASLTMLTKNSFLDEINKQYVLTARAKGLTERRVLYGHVFRNAMLIVIAGFPAAFVGILFTGALLIEIIFSLDGLGLLGFEAAINRDYPVMFGTLYVFTLLGLLHESDRRSDLHRWSIRASTSSARADGDAAIGRRRARLLGVPLRSIRRRRRWPTSAPTGAASGRCGSSWRCSSSALFAELIANDRPLLVCYDGQLLLARCFRPIRRPTFGGDFPTEADYRDPLRERADRARRAGRSGRSMPLQLRHGHPGTCRCPRPRRRAGSTGSAPTTRRATCWRG